jgi:hypothetical protein
VGAVDLTLSRPPASKGDECEHTGAAAANTSRLGKDDLLMLSIGSVNVDQ